MVGHAMSTHPPRSSWPHSEFLSRPPLCSHGSHATVPAHTPRTLHDPMGGSTTTGPVRGPVRMEPPKQDVFYKQHATPYMLLHGP
eukprot:3253160-Pyramimonas_sp.AAC.5